MADKNKKIIFLLLIVVSTVILVVIGSSFAYFVAVTSSAENAITVGAATFSLDLEDDTSLIKSSLIPSEERYVDYASMNRVRNGEFIKPYEDPNTGNMVKEGTACVDDNLNEICSIYSFTVINTIVSSDMPLTLYLTPSVNTFENLYAKVLDGNKQEIVGSTIQLMDDRYETEIVDGVKKYRKNSEGEWVKKIGFDDMPVPSIVLPVEATLSSALKDDTTGEIIPARNTYSIVLWINETGTDQNASDSNKMFSSKLTVELAGSNGRGITGTIAVVGVEP